MIEYISNRFDWKSQSLQQDEILLQDTQGNFYRTTIPDQQASLVKKITYWLCTQFSTTQGLDAISKCVDEIRDAVHSAHLETHDHLKECLNTIQKLGQGFNNSSMLALKEVAIRRFQLYQVSQLAHELQRHPIQNQKQLSDWLTQSEKLKSELQGYCTTDDQKAVIEDHIQSLNQEAHASLGRTKQACENTLKQFFIKIEGARQTAVNLIAIAVKRVAYDSMLKKQMREHIGQINNLYQECDQFKAYYLSLSLHPQQKAVTQLALNRLNQPIESLRTHQNYLLFLSK
jgi:hypothetical protein